MSRLLQGALAGQGWAQALHHHLALLPLTSHHPWHVQQWNPFGNILDAFNFNCFLLNSLALTYFCPCPPCVQCHSPVGGSCAQLHQWPFPTCCSRTGVLFLPLCSCFTPLKAWGAANIPSQLETGEFLGNRSTTELLNFLPAVQTHHQIIVQLPCRMPDVHLEFPNEGKGKGSRTAAD